VLVVAVVNVAVNRPFDASVSLPPVTVVVAPDVASTH
jgi:hypothetical protein